MIKNQPKTAKGQHREIEVSIVAWIDLLGYGSMLQESQFEPFHDSTKKAIARIDLFQMEVARKSGKTFPSMTMNDGAVLYKDLSPRSKEGSFEFLYKAFKLFSHINGIERKYGFPGARMVIATGFRIRRKSSLKEHLMNGIGKYILEKVKSGKMNIEEAIIYSLMTRPLFDAYPELQANFAFSKAYIADAGGSKKGIGGPHCYVDTSLFEEELPEWLRFKGFVDWEDRGLNARFGILDGIHKEVAKKKKFAGILDAFDVASRISSDERIIEKLRNSRFVRFQSNIEK